MTLHRLMTGVGTSSFTFSGHDRHAETRNDFISGPTARSMSLAQSSHSQSASAHYRESGRAVGEGVGRCALLDVVEVDQSGA